MNKVFVETTAQVSRLTAPSRVRTALESWLTGRDILTSSAVFLEFQRVVIDSHRRVLPVLDEVPNDGDGMLRLAEFYGALANSANVRSDRQAKRVLAVVASIQARFGDDPFVRVEDLRAFIRGEIQRLKNSRFFVFGYNVDARDIRSDGGYLDSLECSVARDGLDAAMDHSRMTSCNADMRQCAVRSFIQRDQGLIRDLARELSSSDPKASTAAERVADFSGKKLGGRKAIGQRLCWPLGDVLIALECPKDALLLTSDHHFEIICPAVGRFPARFDYMTGEVSESDPGAATESTALIS